MKLAAQLTRDLIRLHPSRAAAALERLSPPTRAQLIAALTPALGSSLVARMAPKIAIDTLREAPLEATVAVLAVVPLDLATRLLRRIGDQQIESVLERLPVARSKAIRAQLRFPEDTAGAFMDPEVLALSEDLTARVALVRVKATPEHARYNLYVLDRDQMLTGVLNLRELFLARPSERLDELMVRDPQCIDASASRDQVLAHRGWREAHALPVVDSHGCFLGAIRYRTLRHLEEEQVTAKSQDSSATQALGELFAAGFGGLLDSLAAPADGHPPKE